MIEQQLKVSIIIPVYNVRNELEECLLSALQQDIEEYEIICIDDCSTDNSYEILMEFEKKNPRIRVFKNDENRGLSATRNVGLQHAIGEYIWFVDSDDVLEVNVLSELYKKAKDKELDILYFNKDIFCDASWRKNGVEAIRNVQNLYDSVFDGKELFCQFSKNNYMSNAYTQLIRRSFLLENNLSFYDGIVHEDILFFPLTILSATRVSAVSDAPYHYRKRAGSITSRLTIDRKRSMYVVFKEILSFWEQHRYEEPVNLAIETYLRKVYWGLSDFADVIAEDDSPFFENAASSFLYKILIRHQEMVKKAFVFTPDEIKRMKNADGVWIYGAGVYGRQLYKYLTDIDIEVKGFVVTESSGEAKYRSKKILDINSFAKSDELFVVGVSAKFRKEIVDKLTESGNDNWIIARKEDECSVELERKIKNKGNEDGLNIGFRQIGSMGDCLISLKLYQEIVKLAPTANMYVLNANESYYESIFYGQSNLKALVKNVDTTVENTQFDLIIEVRFVPVIVRINKEKLERLAPDLYSRVVKVLEYQKRDHINSGNYQYDNRILVDRAKIKGWNRYTLLGNGIFNISNQKVDFYLNEAYREEYKKRFEGKQYITFNCGAHIHSEDGTSQTKIWPASHMNRLIQMIKRDYPQYTIIQMGDSNAIKVEGADEYIFNENLELVKWILRGSSLHLDSEGGLVHIATQLGTKCVVVFGPTPIWFFGYEGNLNIKSDVCNECKGLLLDWYTRCLCYDKAKCMVSIRPEMVYERISEANLL